MKPGDIYWVQLPRAGGREQAGRRPALVLQDDVYAGSLPLVVVLPLTSAIAAVRFPGTLRIEATPANGLQGPSVILAFQIRAIDRQRVRDRIGEVDPEVLTQIYSLLDLLFGRIAPSA